MGLTSNLLASAVTAGDCVRKYLLVGALFQFLGTLYYLPIAIRAGRLWDEMRNRKGRPSFENARDFLQLRSQDEAVYNTSLQAAFAMLLVFVGLTVLCLGMLWAQRFDAFCTNCWGSLELLCRNWSVAQTVANGISAGALYALVAVGFGPVYSASHFFHFSHGAAITFGAYCGYYLLNDAKWPLAAAIVCSIACTAILLLLVSAGIYEQMRRRASTPLTLLVASLGVLVVVEAAIAIVFGGETLRFESHNPIVGRSLLGARVTATQLLTITSSLILIIITGSLFRWTKLGRLVRAIANSPELAATAGIRVSLIVCVVFAFGAALGAAAGLLSAYDTGLTPVMGFRLLIFGVVAALIGGLDKIAGALIGGLFVGLAQNFCALWLPTQWQDAVLFVMLLGIILLRPYGLFGRRPQQINP
jgi:branched-chain amino acid transport system permease protein